MAVVNARLGAYDNERCVVTIRYNTANGTVQSVTVANNSAKTLYYKVWLLSDPSQFSEGTVAGGVTKSFAVPGGVHYSPTELPEGDPGTTNFGYTAVVS